MTWQIYRIENGQKTVVGFADDQHEAALILESEREKVDDEMLIGAELIGEEKTDENHMRGTEH